ncbi:MAG: PadR family transcriptional regulator [Lachnospiraceae bacterium]
MNTQMKKGILELCVLSMLGKEDRYGYELTEELSEEMSIAPGTLYLILKRLKDDERVETYLVESESGPARKYYHLTQKGIDSLNEQRNEWQQFIRVVEKFIGE